MNQPELEGMASSVKRGKKRNGTERNAISLFTEELWEALPFVKRIRVRHKDFLPSAKNK